MLVYFKGNGVWENAEDVTNVVNGKFSDGEYCYTVVDGVITSKDICTVSVFMNICADTTADGSGYVSVRIQAQDSSNYLSGNLITVATNVTVSFTIQGDSSGNISDSITLTSGNSSYGPISFGPGFAPGENTSTITIDSVSPGSSGNQTYNFGSENVGSC
jgi:hypothetical protein